MSALDDKKLDELLALAEKATPGERSWQKDSEGCWDCLEVKTDPYKLFEDSAFTYTERSIMSADGLHTQGWIDVEEDDAAFIAACSPETIRALVEEIKRHRQPLTCEFCAGGLHECDKLPTYIDRQCQCPVCVPEEKADA